MSDLDQVLRLWQQTNASGEDYVLATIVRVEGSSYRKPGARMLITQGGMRAGTISGGCLEADVSKQAWWLTQHGPVVKAYSTSFESDDRGRTEIERPYGLGCGGVVHLLLERRATAEEFLQTLHTAFQARQALVCSVKLEGAETGTRCTLSSDGVVAARPATELLPLSQEAWTLRQSQLHEESVWAEYIPPRCGLFIFGAGDDAKPLLLQARTLGWHITVADGRAHLATRTRFPEADVVHVLKAGEVSGLGLLESDAAVVMTHSYEQDRRLLQQLLPMPMVYRGVLGPRYRTADLLEDATATLGGTVREWMKKIHSPAGLDLGGDSPATIALAILAEIQATVSKGQQRAAALPNEESALNTQASPDPCLAQ